MKTTKTSLRGRPCLPAMTESEMIPFVLNSLSSMKDATIKEVKSSLRKSLRKRLHKLDYQCVDSNTPRFEKTISNVFSHGKINQYIHSTNNLFNKRMKTYTLNNRGIDFISNS